MTRSATLAPRSIIIPDHRPNAAVRLVCFPYAAGGPGVFRPWNRLLPPWVELALVSLPGREARLSEPPLRTVDAVVDVVQASLMPLLDRPTVLLGHSLGGIHAFEVARRLRAAGQRHPAMLIVSGIESPRVRERLDLAGKPDREFIKGIQELGGTPPGVLSSPELVELLLPLLRADFGMAEEYTYTEAPLIASPIVAIRGASDSRVKAGAVARWGDETTGRFMEHVVPGDHFFIASERERVLNIVLEEIAAAIRSNATGPSERSH